MKPWSASSGAYKKTSASATMMVRTVARTRVRSPRPNVVKESILQKVVEYRVGDQREHRQEDEHRHGLRDQQRVAVHRGQQEGVKAALLTFGDEQPTRAQERREQERDGEHPGRQLTGDRCLVEPEVEDHKGGEREQRHGRQRLECAQLEP